MSFTSTVKNEVSKLSTIDSENISELSAIIRTIGTYRDGIRIVTENASVARRVFGLVKDTYDVHPSVSVRKGYNFKKGFLYVLEFHQKKELILTDLSILDYGIYLDVPKSYMVDDEDLLRAYLRGLFLAVGSINDPKTSRYHLEFLVDSKKYAEFIQKCLNRYDLNSKVLKRDNKYMIYVKEAEKIGDFLRIIKAYDAVMYYEDIRIYRDHKNMTNRLNNCEQANVDKIIQTGMEQLKEIEFLEEKGVFDLLDEKVKIVATYRKKYPEVSLNELSEIISVETGTKITKSGIHHRFHKLKEFVNRIKKD